VLFTFYLQSVLKLKKKSGAKGLISSCNHVTEVPRSRALRFVRPVLKVLVQNAGDFMDLILL